MVRLDHIGQVLNAILSKLDGTEIPAPEDFSNLYLNDAIEFAQKEWREVQKIMNLR